MSRCEKFGYGVMVTQVAATAPGVVALHSSGTKALTRTNTYQLRCFKLVFQVVFCIVGLKKEQPREQPSFVKTVCDLSGCLTRNVNQILMSVQETHLRSIVNHI